MSNSLLRELKTVDVSGFAEAMKLCRENAMGDGSAR
jgi:hypothetical protein